MAPNPISMALPIVTNLTNCADYTKVFEPFLPQLYELPNQVYTTISDTEGLKQLYVNTNPAISSLAFSIATFPIFLLVSEINKNYSQVDRVWSILPTLFHIHYAIWARMAGVPTQRVDNVLAFSVLWTLRLTFNYWRRGGYNVGSEDYRWLIIQKYIGGAPFFLLNVVFISSFQILILWAVVLPTYLLLLTSRVNPELSTVDMVIGRVLIGLVVVEYFADGQQWTYQEAKKQYRQTAKVPSGWTRAQLDRGFVTTGLWKYSRHPNFAAEQLIWVLLYVWGCVQTQTMWNWTSVGMLFYLAVFQGSTPITEAISKGKYPEYGLYQERVGRSLPKLFGKGWNEKEIEQIGPQYAERAKKGKSSL